MDACTYAQAEQRAVSCYGEFMMDGGGHDLYLALDQAAELEVLPWSPEPAHLMNLGIDAALSVFAHPYYPAVDSLIDFLRCAFGEYGPATQQAAVSFLKAAAAYDSAFER
ncbi:MAG: hypothetical protein M5U05_18090 [Anaerolineales bacterium]|nr:hypothetical protein [Anaerolineales bacterium]